MSSPSPSGSPPSSPFSPEWVQSLPASERRRLAELVEPKLSRWIPNRPTPPQAAFLLLPNRDALYGGAAGGGKSDALLMGALQHADVPGYAAILFRRTFADLARADALMDRAGKWLGGTAARWNEQKHVWRFPSGASLSFGYMENDADRYAYQGSAFQYVGFDELTQFRETQFRYLFSRQRRLSGFDVPIRMRSASNPGGVGHEWVYQRYFVEGPGKGRVFVPARLEDNPYLDRDDYEKSLAELDPVERARLRHGDWRVRASGPLFDRSWFKIVDEVQGKIVRVVRFWDLAATEPKPTTDPDWAAGKLVALLDSGRYCILHGVRTRAKPEGVEKLIQQTAIADVERVGRKHPIRIEQEPGSSGVNTIDHYQRRVLLGYDVRGIRSTGSKVQRAMPLSSAAQAGNVDLLRGPWVNDFLDEVHSFPHGSHDDQVDAASGAHEQLSHAQAFIV